MTKTLCDEHNNTELYSTHKPSDHVKKYSLGEYFKDMTISPMTIHDDRNNIFRTSSINVTSALVLQLNSHL